MKKLIISLLILRCLSDCYAQETHDGYQNFPVVVSLQFHSFSMPFKRIGDHFKNVGIGLGTEISHSGGSQQWAQSIQVVWHRNKTMGNGIQLYTQAIYRPEITNDLFGEIKLGVGYQFLYRPVDAYRFKNGTWESVGRKGKGMWMFPVNIGAGTVVGGEPLTTIALNYQWMILKGYNTDVPLFPQSTIILGSRSHQ